MLTLIAAPLMIMSASEPFEIGPISKLYGSPTSIERSFKVTCAERTYSFRFSNAGGETLVELDREPIAPSEKLSSSVLDALQQFYDAPTFDASCSKANAREPAGVLLLEIEGPNKAPSDKARAACIERGGLFDWKSLWILKIEDETANLLRDEIGQCLTKEYIDEINRQNRNSKK